VRARWRRTGRCSGRRRRVRLWRFVDVVDVDEPAEGRRAEACADVVVSGDGVVVLLDIDGAVGFDVGHPCNMALAAGAPDAAGIPGDRADCWCSIDGDPQTPGRRTPVLRVTPLRSAVEVVERNAIRAVESPGDERGAFAVVEPPRVGDGILGGTRQIARVVVADDGGPGDAAR